MFYKQNNTKKVGMGKHAGRALTISRGVIEVHLRMYRITKISHYLKRRIFQLPVSLLFNRLFFI